VQDEYVIFIYMHMHRHMCIYIQCREAASGGGILGSVQGNCVIHILDSRAGRGIPKMPVD